MQFNRREMQAILKIANAMVTADDRVEENEIQVMTLELLRFGVPAEDVDGLIEKANRMDANEALAILATLDTERKKYVSSYLGTIMAADGDINEKEIALWKLVSSLCGFPEMNIKDAIEYLVNL